MFYCMFYFTCDCSFTDLEKTAGFSRWRGDHGGAGVSAAVWLDEARLPVDGQRVDV